MNIRKKVVITSAIFLSILMCSCNSESNKNGSSVLQTETTSASDIFTKKNEEENNKSTLSKVENDKSDFIISKNILISYEGCESYVVIPDGVKKIAEGAFWSVDYIEAVDIPCPSQAKL